MWYVVVCGFCGKQLEDYGESDPPAELPTHVTGTGGLPCPGSGCKPSSVAHK